LANTQEKNNPLHPDALEKWALQTEGSDWQMDRRRRPTMPPWMRRGGNCMARDIFLPKTPLLEIHLL